MSLTLKESMLKRLEIIKTLKKNWNGYNGEPIHPNIICIVELLVNIIDNITCITPTGRGTIQIEWENNSGYFELEIYKDRITTLLMDSDGFVIFGEEKE